MVDRKAGVQSLFDEVSATYDSTGVDFFGQIARRLITYARLRQASTVLDVGCGAGAALLAASEAVGANGRVLGIDLAPGMVERAERLVDELRLDNVRVELGDAEAPPTPPASVDAIVASLVLFFLPEVDRALDAYAETLVPGGTLAFSTFAGGDDWEPLDRLLTSFVSEPPGAEEDAWFESSAGIRRQLGAHGFTDVSIEEVTHAVDFPSVASFHEWTWSTGWRATWSAIPPDRREAAKAAVDGYLEPRSRRDGSLTLATAVRYTRARNALKAASARPSRVRGSRERA
jgi:ubiquinone/menaquinone biosynthesis C-methylase UbiE